MRKILVYSAEIKDMNNEFSCKTEIIKLANQKLSNRNYRTEVTELPNRNYREIQNNYQHLRDITLNHYDTKSDLPIHMILGISDFKKN